MINSRGAISFFQKNPYYPITILAGLYWFVMFSYFSLPGDTAQVGCICTDSAVCWVGCVSPSSETTFGKSGSKGREWLGTTCASLCGGHVQHFPAVTIGR